MIRTLLFLLLPFIASTARAAENFMITSPVFEQGQAIPVEYTCRGKDLPIPVQWANVPEKTQSFVLIMSDPDAPKGTWYHWVLYNIPGKIREIDPQKKVPFKTGKNSWGNAKYQGPCPPSGTHRYEFKLYALDQVLDLSDAVTVEELIDSMQGHVIGETSLTGNFSR